MNEWNETKADRQTDTVTTAIIHDTNSRYERWTGRWLDDIDLSLFTLWHWSLLRDRLTE